MFSEHFIYIFDAPRGLARWRYGWRLSDETLYPLLDAARWLLELGLADPADRLTALRGGQPAMSCQVGVGAKLVVVDAPSRGPVFARFDPRLSERFRRSGSTAN